MRITYDSQGKCGEKTDVQNTTLIEDGAGIFYYNQALFDWNSSLVNLQYGKKMFSNTALTSFNSDLSNLTYGREMFMGTKLTTFNSNLSNLTNGSYMFCDTALTEWDIDLSNLTNGSYMFYYATLESFNSDLSNLVNGTHMFYYSTLSAFSGDLSNLKSGSQMFKYCNLDTESVKNIAYTINNLSGNEDWTYQTCDQDGNVVTSEIAYDDRGKIDITWDNATYPTDQKKVDGYCQEISHKMWNVELNGSSVNKLDAIDSNVYDTAWGSTNVNASKITSVNTNVAYQDDEPIYYLKPNLRTVTDVAGGNDDGTTSGGGEGMFYGTNITSFDSDLSSLISGVRMFYETSLSSFNSNLDSLIYGEGMFKGTNMTEWDINLPKLTDGSWMFYGTALESFDSDLSSLTTGYGMFWGCKLNSNSITNIASTINNVNDSTTSPTLHVGLYTSDPSEDDEIQLNRIYHKGWNLDVNGTSFTAMSDEDLKTTKLKYNKFTTLTDLEATYPNFIEDIDESNYSWNHYLDNLADGSSMFYDCSLTTFTSDLSSLTNGNKMFYQSNLESFDSDLPKLTDGEWMFSRTALTSFNSDLSSLISAYEMFSKCTALTSFNSDLPSLTYGSHMFSQCNSLTSFNSDLSSLTSGYAMFMDCTKLTSFDSDLSKLTSGYAMFSKCKLNTASVQKIASTINTVSSDFYTNISIGIGNKTPNSAESSAFNTIASKGWKVYVNGDSNSHIWSSTSSTNLTEGEEQSTPIPFYAKPIQTTEENAEYVDNNNNYYNIVGAQFIYGDDISTYGTFTSFEHAIEEISLSLGLTPYEKTEEE